MTIEQKKEIQNLLNAHCEVYASQAKAANALKGVSEATVISIRKNNWESISAAMWTNIGKQLGYSAKGAWNVVKTTNYKALTELFEDAKEYGNVFAITGDPGCGKTLTAEHFSRTNKNVYHIECAEYYNRKVFLSKLLERMGKDNTGSVSEMMDLIVDTLLKQEDPLIIMDEADKLNDNVLYFFITLYNQLKGKCAIVLLATDHLAKRINRGKKLNKKGYGEIFSRIGRRFISLKAIDSTEVASICSANGITDKLQHSFIFNDCEGDLRRVNRAAHRVRKQAEKQAA